MTNIPPNPPSTSRPVERDEWIAIFVTFATLGSIFFWGMSKTDNGFNLLSRPMLLAPTSETTGSPDAAVGESILSLGTSPLKANSGESGLNVDGVFPNFEQLGASLATLTPITETVEELEPNFKGFGSTKTETEAQPKLSKSPKTNNQETTAPFGKVITGLAIGEVLSESPVTTATPLETVKSPITATEAIPMAPVIAGLTGSSPETAQSPESEIPAMAESPEPTTPETAQSPESEIPAMAESPEPTTPETAQSPESEIPATAESPEPTTPETAQSPESEIPATAESPAETPLVGAAAPSPETFPPGTIKFSDIPDGFWASGFIQPLAQRNVVALVENEKFEPDKPITRAEFATQIPKVFEDESTEKAVNYEDVESDSAAQPEIQTATKYGFLSGYPGNIFRPEQQMPRLQVLVALASGLNLKAPSNPDEVLSVYQDKDKIPDWAKKQIAAATVAGLVVNHPDVSILNPDKPATRAEVAAMFYQALVELKKVDRVSSEYIVNPQNQN
ncbi:MAG: S-layer homology domain-containing protein [Microcoleaceae cyanobacterium]